MKKKNRLRSFRSVESYCRTISGIDRFDAIVQWNDDGNNVIEVFSNITISIEKEEHYGEEEAYSISIHWGDDCNEHQISFADLPQQCKSCYDLIDHWRGTNELSIRDNWHKNLLIYIIPYCAENPSLRREILKRLEA